MAQVHKETMIIHNFMANVVRVGEALAARPGSSIQRPIEEPIQVVQEAQRPAPQARVTAIREGWALGPREPQTAANSAVGSIDVKKDEETEKMFSQDEIRAKNQFFQEKAVARKQAKEATGIAGYHPTMTEEETLNTEPHR